MAGLVKFQAILARFVFLAHGSLSFALFYNNSSQPVYWLFIVPLILLVVDIALRIEIKYFWMSAFLYITTFLPMIWIVELDLLESRILERKNMNETILGLVQSNASPLSPNDTLLRKSNEIDFLNLPKEVVAKKICEIGLVIGIILGRWITPKKYITHNQLLSMLFSRHHWLVRYICTSVHYLQ